MKKSIQLILSVSIVALLGILFACSGNEVKGPIGHQDDEDEGSSENIDPAQVVDINTGAVIGKMYRFWGTKPMINQNRFISSGYVNSLEDSKLFVDNINMVRVLGGRTDNLNHFYKGVDADGNIITDFEGLLVSMRAFMETGFKPRIVLDNVPWEMNAVQEQNKYGNTNPPDNYDVWRQYINASLQTLIGEFGYDEVKTWRFRVGTEPNYVPEHWNGTKEDYLKHYDITVDEVLKVIPEAIIGPGNLLTEGVAKWTTEIIDHCATGVNYATGETGTRMSFFSLSFYEKIDQNTVRFPTVVKPYREKLDSYSEFRDIPFDIQEFGMTRDENGKVGVSLNDGTEFGASWYATIADMVYANRIAEVYDWGQDIEACTLPSGRRHVTTMFLKMEDGNRLAAEHSLAGYAGVIPVLKDNKMYLLAYNHNTERTSTASQIIYPKIKGGEIDNNEKWMLNEWTVDSEHGIMMHQLYADIRTAGVEENEGGRIYGNRPSDRFGDGWKDVLNANLSSYESLADLPLTVRDSLVQKSDDGTLTLKIDLPPHCVKLLELIPQ